MKCEICEKAVNESPPISDDIGQYFHKACIDGWDDLPSVHTGYYDRDHAAKIVRACRDNIGPWLSAALEDPLVCAEMKADIRIWLDAIGPLYFKKVDK